MLAARIRRVPDLVMLLTATERAEVRHRPHFTDEKWTHEEEQRLRGVHGLQIQGSLLGCGAEFVSILSPPGMTGDQGEQQNLCLPFQHIRACRLYVKEPEGEPWRPWS